MVKVGKFYLGLQDVKEVQMCLLGLRAHWQMYDSSDLIFFPPCMGEEGLNPI